MSIKRKLSLLFILLLLVFGLCKVDAKRSSSNSLELFGKVITVDAGHGGRDPGTRYGNILEKDLNLEISKQLEKELTKKGAIVYMTRDKDEDLSWFLKRNLISKIYNEHEFIKFYNDRKEIIKSELMRILIR